MSKVLLLAGAVAILAYSLSMFFRRRDLTRAEFIAMLAVWAIIILGIAIWNQTHPPQYMTVPR